MCLTECPGQSISRRRCVEIEAGELSDMGAGRRKDFGALSIRECKGVVKLGYISTNAPTVVQTHHVRQVAKIGHRAIPSGWTWWRLWRRRWRVISRSFLGWIEALAISERLRWNEGQVAVGEAHGELHAESRAGLNGV